jgi:hypothetical protein
MGRYVYQIQGALENAGRKFCGFRVIVADAQNMEQVDVPAEIFNKETRAYIQFRLKIEYKFNIKKLPPSVENNIRAPLGRWLDYWVIKNFYGSTSNSTNLNS